MQPDPFIHIWLIDQERERQVSARAIVRLARAARRNDLNDGPDARAGLRRRIHAAASMAAQHVPSSAR